MSMLHPYRGEYDIYETRSVNFKSKDELEDILTQCMKSRRPFTVEAFVKFSQFLGRKGEMVWDCTEEKLMPQEHKFTKIKRFVKRRFGNLFNRISTVVTSEYFRNGMIMAISIQFLVWSPLKAQAAELVKTDEKTQYNFKRYVSNLFSIPEWKRYISSKGKIVSPEHRYVIGYLSSVKIPFVEYSLGIIAGVAISQVMFGAAAQMYIEQQMDERVYTLMDSFNYAIKKVNSEADRGNANRAELQAVILESCLAFKRAKEQAELAGVPFNPQLEQLLKYRLTQLLYFNGEFPLFRKVPYYGPY